MPEAKYTTEKLRELVTLYYFEGLNWKDCAERLQIAERTVHNWREQPAFKEARQWYVDMLEADAVPTALTDLIRKSRAGDTAASAKLMDIYKGIKNRVEGEMTVQQFFRMVTDGHDGREDISD